MHSSFSLTCLSATHKKHCQKHTLELTRNKLIAYLSIQDYIFRKNKKFQVIILARALWNTKLKCLAEHWYCYMKGDIPHWFESQRIGTFLRVLNLLSSSLRMRRSLNTEKSYQWNLLKMFDSALLLCTTFKWYLSTILDGIFYLQCSIWAEYDIAGVCNVLQDSIEESFDWKLNMLWKTNELSNVYNFCDAFVIFAEITKCCRESWLYGLRYFESIHFRECCHNIVMLTWKRFLLLFWVIKQMMLFKDHKHNWMIRFT